MLTLSFLLFAAAQLPAAPAAPALHSQPVRVWLGADARVYIQTDEDGYLIVLRRDGDGRVDILFPDRPGSAAYARAGTYEILNAGDRMPYTVLAALASRPFRAAEFTRGGAWSSDALATETGTSAETALTEVVQRMLGDESFNYDLATSAGAAMLPPVAAAPVLIVSEPILILDEPFRVHHAHRRRATDRVADPGLARAPEAPALAVYERGKLAALPPIVVVQRPERSRAPLGTRVETRMLMPVEPRQAAPPASVSPALAMPRAAFFVLAPRVLGGPAPPPAAVRPRNPASPSPRAAATPRVFALPHAGSAVVRPQRR